MEPTKVEWRPIETYEEWTLDRMRTAAFVIFSAIVILVTISGAIFLWVEFFDFIDWIRAMRQA
jgi:hypothetical protein